MTLKEIKSQFQPGQKWRASRVGRALVVHGNLGTTVLPDKNVEGQVRELVKAGSVDLVWKIEGQERNLFTKWPKASEIIEARPGYLKFAYDNGVVVTLELDAQADPLAAQKKRAAELLALDELTTENRIELEEIDKVLNPPDFAVTGSGSVYLFCPLTEAAQAWLDEHCSSDESHQYLGKNLAVEHRYIGDIIKLAIQDGLNAPVHFRQY